MNAADFSSLYDAPSRLDGSCAHHRIFAQTAYARVRSEPIVPIVHLEALAMAAWFPVCWQRRPSGLIPVVLRSLLDTGDGQPPGAGRAAGALPMALRSYPVMIAPDLGVDGRVYVDLAVADRPSDAGAPLLMPDGRPSRGLLQRYRAALVARHAIDDTAAMTETLDRHGFFEPWTLDFDLGGAERLFVPDLFVLRLDAVEATAMRRVLMEFGVDAATLVTAHRISLFRIGILLKAARAARHSRGARPPATRQAS